MKSSTNKPVGENEHQRDPFFNLIKPHLGNLNKFVRNEIEYHLAIGELKSDELTPEDVIDAVVLEAFEEYKKQPPKLSLDRWLVKLTMKCIRKEIRRLRQDREEFVHLEEDVPEIPAAEEVTTLGEEVLDFYQPDEDLRMEDIVADPTAENPEQAAELDEALLKVANECLRELPRPWRDAFVLRRVQGYSINEIAEITHQPENKVQQDLQKAESCVKKKLADAGINIPK